MPTSSTPKTTTRASKPAPNTTVTVEAQAIEGAKQSADDDQQVVDMLETLGSLTTDAVELLLALWAAKDHDARSKLINSSDPSVVGFASNQASIYYLIKAQPSHPSLLATPEAARKGMAQLVKEIDRSVLLEVARDLNRRAIRVSDELLQSYRDAGPLYAGTPLGVDYGIEAGIRTGEGDDTQRNGFIFGLRLDYASKTKPAAVGRLPKIKIKD